MKTIIMTILLFSLQGLADLNDQQAYMNRDYQLKNIVGDWDCGQGHNILRFSAEATPKSLVCARQTYKRNNGLCDNTKPVSTGYSRDRDAVCVSGRLGKYERYRRGDTAGASIEFFESLCAWELKVSADNPNEGIVIADPFNDGSYYQKETLNCHKIN